LVLFIGCGDLGTGAAHVLQRAGFPVVIVERPRPQAVRRRVAFAEAARRGETQVEGVRCRRVALPWLLGRWQRKAGRKQKVTMRRTPTGTLLEDLGFVPLVVGDWKPVVRALQPQVVIDARLAKRKLPGVMPSRTFHVALGPGHVAGRDCDAVVETLRGGDLGRVLWRGAAAPDTGIPGEIGGMTSERVLRAPVSGVLLQAKAIGTQVRAGEVVARVGNRAVRTPIAGVVRGMLVVGDRVHRGQKLGDVDPRRKAPAVHRISDKARQVGHGVLVAITSQWNVSLPRGSKRATSPRKRRQEKPRLRRFRD
jgi:xanthine dehydrogenase accessory factor